MAKDGDYYMKTPLKFLIAGTILLLTQNIMAAPSKVQICHLPPVDPGNFHTITVSEDALPVHLAHGDLPGPCSTYGEMLCDDGNICTIDAIDPETETCLNEQPAVNCDDGLLCTADSCDPINGCQYAPIECDDGDLCTVDACSEFNGQCTYTPIDCGYLGVCLEDGMCDFPCEGIVCEPIDQCHEAGACVLPGECLEGVPVVDGTLCDDGNPATYDDECVQGSCVGTCPELTLSGIDIPAVGPTWALVSWITNIPTIGRVEYGFTTDFGKSTAETTDNPLTLSDLEPFTIYYFRVVVRTAGCNNHVYSPYYSFRTQIE